LSTCTSGTARSALAVLAGYAVVFTVAAARFFRWD
jgi:hypothetical protein